ncbi:MULTISPECIES: hypothetical protein [unclassified Pseudomonas]|uniref:hypothetical protein n=1 Tax=Pseudomonas TaxID=286 RepID=UPI0006D3C5ED|nr:MULTISPECIES: hypothetical protein [unclassified Pseudomonas]MDU4253901.1 hypothetical protein [Pseudomonas sp.]OBY87603.1 hypothetical protein A6723_030385 [Pseudomonas sp. AU11447]
MAKPRTDKVRRQDANRQQRLRDREAAHKQAVGSEKIKLEIYAGTRTDIDDMCQVGGFEEEAEAITLGLRYLGNMARNEPEQYRRALNPRNLV